MVVDLRSDTVTRPSPGMRAAMAAAEVGDDVLGDDPTVIRLQERTAELLGQETTLFVPSGTMANQLALRLHCQAADDVLASEEAHLLAYEAGAPGAIAGVQVRCIGRGGRFAGAEVEAAFQPDGPHAAPTRLVCVENTHNRAGGAVWRRPALDEVVAAARRLGVRLHLDGARLMNAAAAAGETPRALAAGFDTVSLAFSKGLGAPVGSVLAGSRAVMERAPRFRRMLGGGMRQAGILAAAALYALDHNVARLADDHANARRLADGLAGVAGVRIDADKVETNIVIFEVISGSAGLTAAEVARRTESAAGVRLHAIAPTRLRAVTHLDVDAAGVDRAVAAVRAALAGAA
jgi:threonine aldolase